MWCGTCADDLIASGIMKPEPANETRTPTKPDTTTTLTTTPTAAPESETTSTTVGPAPGCSVPTKSKSEAPHEEPREYFTSRLSTVARSASERRALDLYLREDRPPNKPLLSSAVRNACDMHFDLLDSLPPSMASGIVWRIKESKTLGNTSVSMGLASWFFADALNNKGKILGCLNCGTGGMKIQFYAQSAAGIIHLLKETKDIKDFAPNHIFAQDDLGRCAQQLTRYLQNAVTELDMGDVAWRTEFYAFVTGPTREGWENLPSGCALDRLARAAMNTVFPIGVRPWCELLTESKLRDCSARTRSRFCSADESKKELNEDSKAAAVLFNNTVAGHFLPQELEALLEEDAMLTFNRQVKQRGYLPDNAELVATFGIGRGSCQSSVRSSTGARIFTLAKGMDAPEPLRSQAREYLEQLRMAICEAGEDAFARGKTPMIAFKSGALLFMSEPVVQAMQPKRQDPAPSQPDSAEGEADVVNIVRALRE